MPLTPKERMLAAYRGETPDRIPVAPEFWYYIGAKVLGVSMETFEREGLLGEGLLAAFRKYDTDGWGIAFPAPEWGDRTVRENAVRQPDGRLRVETVTRRGRQTFSTVTVYDKTDPSWVAKPMAVSEEEIPAAADLMLSDDVRYDTGAMTRLYERVGGGYLCEVWTGCPFFDFIEGLAGFETAISYLLEEDEDTLLALRERYTLHQLRMIDECIERTPFESYVIGCSSSCNSLIGPRLWRKWDKPYIARIAEHLHARGKLLHVHFHGKSIETAEDFAQLGIDCVCPFERGPGGDVNTPEDLRHVRDALWGRTAFNGNLHTTNTLLTGTPGDVRREVRELLEVFSGDPRFILGTGDQVAPDTPEENLYAMVEEARRFR